MRVIETHIDHKVDIPGIDNNLITSISMVNEGGVTWTITGEVMLSMHQHVHYGKNKTAHSSPQIENYKNIVDDLSIKVGGKE